MRPRLYNSRQSFQNIDEFQDFQRNVGVIKSVWLSKGNNVKYISFGTGSLLSNNIVLTCSHNIYEPIIGQVCSYAQFILPQKMKKLGEYIVYRTEAKFFYKMNKKQQLVNFDEEKPSQNQLALIYLKNPVENIKCFPALKKQRIDSLIHKKQELQIIGFSSLDLNEKIDFKDFELTRRKLKGKYHSSTDQIINHDITSTSKGFSGSPIFKTDENNQKILIGIHTHKGPSRQFNSGLYFNPKIINKIIQYYDELNIQHQNITAKALEIKYQSNSDDSLQESDEEHYESQQQGSSMEQIFI